MRKDRAPIRSSGTKRGFQAMVERAGEAGGFDMKIHPHILRHACGFKLANDGVDTRTIQAYLGHKSIQHTVRYTELAPTRFIQKLIPGLTAPASFEATVGGSGCSGGGARRLSFQCGVSVRQKGGSDDGSDTHQGFVYPGGPYP